MLEGAVEVDVGWFDLKAPGQVNGLGSVQD
jgi:hypothetical protein